jgi:hypothetical protein
MGLGRRRILFHHADTETPWCFSVSLSSNGAGSRESQRKSRVAILVMHTWE